MPLKSYDIISHATFPQGITSFELSVNGQVVRSNNIPPNQAGQTLAQISQGWTPPAPGTYLLAVRAANAAGEFGAPAQVRVRVGDGNTVAPRQPSPTRVTVPSRPPSAQTTVPVVGTAIPVRPDATTPPTNNTRPQATATSTRPAAPTAISTRPPAQPTLPPPPLPPLATATHIPAARDTQGPPAPTQTAPVNGISVPCTTVALTWRPPSDPSGIRDYDVEIQRSTGGVYAAEKSWDAVTASSVAFAPSCSTSYRWRIRATDRAGNVGSWSGYETFAVGTTVLR